MVIVTKSHKEMVWRKLALFFLVILALLIYADHPFNSDEGAVLNSAWNLWHSKKIYVDFIENTSPGSPYFVLFSWRIFGAPSYFAAKLISVFAWLFSAFGIIIIVKRLGCHFWAQFFVALLWMIVCLSYPLINYNVHSSFLAVWLLYFTLQAKYQDRVTDGSIVALFGAAVVLFLQTKGLILSLISFIVLCLPVRRNGSFRWKSGTMFLLTFTVCLIVPLSAWRAKTILSSWFILPFRADYLGHSMHSIPIVIIQGFIIGWMIKANQSKKMEEFSVLIFFQAGLFLSCVHLIDYNHMMINAFPFIIFLGVLVDSLIYRMETKKSKRFALSALFLPLLICIAIHIQWTLNRETIYSDFARGEKPRGVFDVNDFQSAKHLYFGPFMMGMYFEMRKENPFPQANMLVCDHACQQKTLEVFQTVRPEYAFLNYEMAERFQYNRENPVDQYILKQYIPCQMHWVGPLEIYARDRCPGSKAP